MNTQPQPIDRTINASEQPISILWKLQQEINLRLPGGKATISGFIMDNPLFPCTTNINVKVLIEDRVASRVTIALTIIRPELELAGYSIIKILANRVLAIYSARVQDLKNEDQE